MQPSIPCPSTPNPPTQPLARHLATAFSNTTATRTRGQWLYDVGGERRRALIFSLGASPINAFSLRNEPRGLLACSLRAVCVQPSFRRCRLRGTRFRAERRHAVRNANAPLQWDAVFALIGLGNVQTSKLETALFRCVQHDSAVICIFCFTLPFIVSFLFFIASFSLFFPSFRFHCRLYRDRFSCSRDEHARGKGKRHPNENEQASIGPFGALGRHSSCEIPQPVYLPICQHISIGVSPLFSTDERNVTVRTICLGI